MPRFSAPYNPYVECDLCGSNKHLALAARDGKVVCTRCANIASRVYERYIKATGRRHRRPRLQSTLTIDLGGEEGQLCGWCGAPGLLLATGITRDGATVSLHPACAWELAMLYTRFIAVIKHRSLNELQDMYRRLKAERRRLGDLGLTSMLEAGEKGEG